MSDEVKEEVFTIPAEDMKKFQVWHEKHLLDKHRGKIPYTGAIGGMYSYIFTPTSIGTFSSVECALCKESCILTNCWDF